MAWYCFWIPRKQAVWNLALASERKNLYEKGEAEFVTALDSDFSFEGEGYDPSSVRYRGDFYVDFDASDVEETIGKVNEFLDLLGEKGVSLNQLRIYASGKKGFHIEVPKEIFIEKAVATGYLYLPAIYREMAQAMYCDTLDLAVYTAKKGRMWRVTNFKRPDGGTYKVHISSSEMRAMTAATYKTLVASPRPILAVEPPTFAPNLGLVWAKAKDTVTERVKLNSKTRNNPKLIQQFAGKAPPTLVEMMNGEGLKEGSGFQAIATQLAIAANAIGINRDDFLSQCNGLCEKHKGDGVRYSTKGKRRAELGRMWDYMHDNPTYVFSAGAIKNLITTSAPDLAVAGEPGEQGSDFAITLGMRVDRMGVHKRNSDGGTSRICRVGFDNPLAIMRLKRESDSESDDGTDFFGYVLSVFLDGHYVGRRTLSGQMLSCAAGFRGFVRTFKGVGCQISDSQVEAISELLSLKAESHEDGGPMYVIHREGLSFAKLPDGRTDVIWLERGLRISKLGQNYMFRTEMHDSDNLIFGTDLMKAPRLPLLSVSNTEGIQYLDDDEVEELKEQLHDLFKINSKENVAKALGWVISCFLCPALRAEHDNQFPLLHIYGSAGTGKSSTMRLLSSFHWYKGKKAPVLAGSSTIHVLNQHASGTCSLPFILDEYKVQDMSRQIENHLETMLKGSFDSGEHGRGRITRSGGVSQVVTDKGGYVAPICYISEQCDSVEAKLHRSVVCALTPQDAENGAPHFKALKKADKHFASVGRLIVETLIFSDDLSSSVIEAKVNEFEDQLEDIIKAQDANRSRYGIAVSVLGLWVLKEILSLAYGDHFNEEISGLMNTLLAPPEERKTKLVYSVKPETVQVLETMSMLSHLVEAPNTQRLIYGSDYLVTPDYIEIRISSAYMKYQITQRITNARPLFVSGSAFASALNQYRGATKSPSSPLGGNGVYRIDTRTLYDEDGVEPFRETSQ